MTLTGVCTLPNLSLICNYRARRHHILATSVPAFELIITVCVCIVYIYARTASPVALSFWTVLSATHVEN